MTIKGPGGGTGPASLWTFKWSVSTQGLKPGIPAEPPAMVFATPTKVLSEGGPAVDFMGANKISDFQRLFQVTLTPLLSRNLVFNILNTKQLLSP